MNNIVKAGLVLFIVSSVCVTALAYVHEITLEPIRLQEEQTEKDAYAALFPGAEEFRSDEKTAPADGVITGITSVYKGGEFAGYIVKLNAAGYGGAINMMAGIKNDGSVSGIKIISHSETPGLGANCETPWFGERFVGKYVFPLIVVKSGTPAENEIDAITSSTITTKAVTEAVNKAYEWYKSEGGGE